MSYSIKTLRQSHIQSQQLLKSRNHTLEEIIQRLSYIQIDAISVIARSHDLVFHARSDTYSIGDGWTAFNRGELFEWFAHARCLIPINHFPYYYRKMLQNRNSEPKWNRDNQHDDLIQEVLKEIEERGPILPDDIENNIDLNVSDGWSSSLKRIINYLTFRGYILTAKRKNFQPYVDITERVIGDLPEDIPDRMEAFWFDVKNSLQANGPSMLHRLLHYNKNQSKFMIDRSTGEKTLKPRQIIKDATRQGKLEKIDVDGIKYPFYGLPKQIEELEDFKPPEEKKVSLLSPFDNALWSRKDLLRQYGFDYKMEIYVPKKEREYGYFALPILYGIEFVGRIDVKLHRNEGYMDYKQWTWEENFSPNNHFWDELTTCMDKFNQFHQVDDYKLNGISNRFKQQINSRLSVL